MNARFVSFWKRTATGWLLALTLPGWGATIPVTSSADSGAGTLRAAINAAGNGDTLDATALPGSIVLASELLVAKGVTILGPGATLLSVDGNAATRVFHITNGANVFIRALTITNGAVSGSYPGGEGAGIWNDHSILTLSNCVICGNNGGTGQGAGIFNDGSSGTAKLSIAGSTLSNNGASSGGGAICNLGGRGNVALSVNGSMLTQNNGGSVAGGAIMNDVSGGLVTVSVTNSTFTRNGAANGGAIANLAFSGTGVVSVINCTFSTNSAGGFGGAIDNNGGTSGAGKALLTLLGCTLCGNSAAPGGGGSIYNLYVNATLEIGNTILQPATVGGNVVNNGFVTSDGYNLSSDNFQGLLNQPTDKVGTDPKLGPLADNGGPTLSHAPLAGSPAIDGGKNFGLTTDQRGAPRPFDFPTLPNASGGDGSDIGTFEAGQPLLSITRSGTSVVLAWLAAGPAFQLQSTTNLIPANWIQVSGSAAMIGNRFYLTNQAGAPQDFYRLIFP